MEPQRRSRRILQLASGETSPENDIGLDLLPERAPRARASRPRGPRAAQGPKEEITSVEGVTKDGSYVVIPVSAHPRFDAHNIMRLQTMSQDALR